MAFDISNVACVGSINVWGIFQVPVYEISQLSTLEQVTAFINSAETIEFGNADIDSGSFLKFLSGSPAINMSKAVELYEDAYNRPPAPFGTPPNFVTDTSFNYSNRTGIFSIASGHYPNKVATGDVYIRIDGRTSSELIETNRTSASSFDDEDSPSLTFQATSSTPGCFLRFSDNGEIKFCRLAIIVRAIFSETTNPLISITGNSNYTNGLGNIFFGMGVKEIKTLSQMGDGSFSFDERPVNPYDPLDPSGPGGGGGTFDLESDPVPLPALPSISSADTGFTRIFNPTLSQVRSLADYLWTDESFFATAWNRVKQVFENPMSAIIAFNLVPVTVPDGGSVEFKLMYIPTGVMMNTALNQFVDVECGTLQVEQVYGSALDFSPYTKISCFLPFVGTVTLNTDEVMGKTLQIRYRVDICSGACVAVIFVDGTVMYQFTGHCAINIPMNSADFSSYISALTAAAKIGLGAVGGAAGALAAAAAPEVTQTTNQTVTRTTERNPETGRQILTGTVTTETTGEETSTKASHSGLTPANIANTVGSVMGSKPHVEHSGSFTGNSGYLGVRRPYLIIERPNLCMPASYQALNGFPAMMTLPLSSCKGFTRVQQVQLTGCTATNPEQAEILEFLKSGVIL